MKQDIDRLRPWIEAEKQVYPNYDPAFHLPELRLKTSQLIIMIDNLRLNKTSVQDSDKGEQIISNDSKAAERKLRMKLGKKIFLSKEFGTRLESYPLTAGMHVETCKIFRLVYANNLLLALSIARRMTNSSGQLEDTVQEAFIGLMNGLVCFAVLDEEYAFSTIAYCWVRAAIYRFLKNSNRPIIIPEAMLTIMRNNRSLPPGLNAKERAMKLGISEEKLVEAEISHLSSFSLDAPMGGESNDLYLSDIISAERIDPDYCNAEEILIKSSELTSSKMQVDKAIAAIAEHNSIGASIIKMFYGIDQEQNSSFEDLSRIHKLTQEKVRSILARTERQLRIALRK
jgi:RNA polymerase sigma factor (sigma-70 family)